MPASPFEPIEMVDLRSLHKRLEVPLDAAIAKVLADSKFINGPEVQEFATALSVYSGAKQVLPCANGTDALQIALMALDLQPGDEVILPAFSFGSAAECVVLLGLTPVFVDVDPQTFNMDPWAMTKVIGQRAKAVIPVHLYGQCADMGLILQLCAPYEITVIEDNAQSLGAEYIWSSEQRQKSGTLGDIGTLSFFPTKNLGCYGDGGAIFTNNTVLANSMKMIANHGWKEKYQHERLGLNSRLDTLQAAILMVKLQYLEDCNARRVAAAQRYDALLAFCEFIQLPYRAPYSTHVFHQYTLIVEKGKRDYLAKKLAQKGIPTAVYYPTALHDLEVFSNRSNHKPDCNVATDLANSVLSIPMHSELKEETQLYIAEAILEICKGF